MSDSQLEELADDWEPDEMLVNITHVNEDETGDVTLYPVDADTEEIKEKLMTFEDCSNLFDLEDLR